MALSEYLRKLMGKYEIWNYLRWINLVGFRKECTCSTQPTKADGFLVKILCAF
jgi:hypothetical protein